MRYAIIYNSGNCVNIKIGEWWQKGKLNSTQHLKIQESISAYQQRNAKQMSFSVIIFISKDFLEYIMQENLD